jgi:hypothetical protein
MSTTFERQLSKRVMAVATLAAGLVLALVQTESASGATLTVCSAGPPSCQFSTIPAALAFAVDGDTVSVAPGSYDGGFTIEKSIRLIGSGQETTSIVGGDPAAVTVSVGENVLIRGVTIREATRTGLVVDGTVTLRDALVTFNNPAEVLSMGGGVLNNGTLVARNTTINHNRAYGGGALGNFGAATLTNSTLSDNETLFDAGGIANYGGSVVVRGSAIERNIAQGTGGILNDGGSALIVDTLIAGNGASHGGIVNRGVFTLRESTITHNQGTPGGPGGILNESGSMVITKSTIDENVAGTSGGGIRNEAEMTVTSSTVNGNASGGIENSGSLTVRSSTVSGNGTRLSGGGITNAAGTLLLIASTVINNTAAFDGGGIWNSASLTLRSSTVTQNTALAGSGGGIFNNPPGTVTLKQSSVSGNVPDDCFGCQLPSGWRLGVALRFGASGPAQDPSTA